MRVTPYEEPISVGSSVVLTGVHFAILNFPKFHALSRGSRSSGGGGRQIILEAEQWRITLAPLADTTQRVETLEKSRGYGITHCGYLSRLDGAVFTSDAARSQMDLLDGFLTFAVGRHVCRVLVEGVGAEGKPDWVEWGTWAVGPYEQRDGWFTPDRADVLTELFPKFAAKSVGETTSVLSRAIAWYATSNTLPVRPDGSLVLTCTALEALAWWQLVQVRRSLSKGAFRKLPAAGRLRLMLDRLGVPLLIPPTLPELESLRKAPNVEDGPGVVCSVRNAIVHAGDSSEEKKGRTPEVIYQAWVLGQWYLELAVLAILEYRGQYSNRTRRTRYSHEVENVPWAG